MDGNLFKIVYGHPILNIYCIWSSDIEYILYIPLEFFLVLISNLFEIVHSYACM